MSQQTTMMKTRTMTTTKTEDRQYHFASPPKHGGDTETEANPVVALSHFRPVMCRFSDLSGNLFLLNPVVESGRSIHID